MFLKQSNNLDYFMIALEEIVKPNVLHYVSLNYISSLNVMFVFKINAKMQHRLSK